MKATLQNVNCLPMRTWRWLGVNETTIEAEVPTIVPIKNIPTPALPEGIQELKAVPDVLDNIQTGMGDSAKDFVCEWKNTETLLHATPEGGSSEPIVYRYSLTEQSPTVVHNTTIVAEKNSQIVVVQIYKSDDFSPHFHAGLTRVVAHEGAQVKLVQIQMMNDFSTHFNNVGAVVEADASVELVQIELGGQRALSGCRSVLNASDAFMGIDTIYLGDGLRDLDFNYLVEHVATRTNSEIHAAGALFGESKKLYRGTIDFLKGSARSVGHESENTLLFSKNARCKSVPVILCGEENVEGQHAATIGKVDEMKMFYLNSRGLDPEQAKRIMVEAQYAPALAKLPTEELKEEVTTYLAERMQVLS